jgi:hypothetical protein
MSPYLKTEILCRGNMMTLSEISNITKVFLPVITKVADVLNDTGKDIAPIGLVKVICD